MHILVNQCTDAYVYVCSLAEMRNRRNVSLLRQYVSKLITTFVGCDEFNESNSWRMHFKKKVNTLYGILYIIGRGELFLMRYIDDQESTITCTLEIRVSNTVDGIMFYIYV